MQMTRTKIGSRKKSRRSSHKKAYYATFRARYSGKLIRRRAKREKNRAIAKLRPKRETPSDLRRRARRVGLKQRVKTPLVATLVAAVAMIAGDNL